VLLQLRAVLHSGADNSDYQSVLRDDQLALQAFVNIDHAAVTQLVAISRALPHIVAQRAVPADVMQRALTQVQHEHYINSYTTDISHVESQHYTADSMPWQLVDYMHEIKQGDKYQRMANMHRRSVKRDAKGQTAAQRYRTLAEGCYESALLDLIAVLDTDPKTNPHVDAAAANRVQQWLDRTVDTTHGNTPDPYIDSVPRVRGSGGQYVRINREPVVGQRLRKYWRQRESLAAAALPLIYGDETDLHAAHVAVYISTQLSGKLQQLLTQRDDD
jgi:hypothetical protein